MLMIYGSETNTKLAAQMKNKKRKNLMLERKRGK